MDYNDNRLSLCSYLPESVTNAMHNDYDTNNDTTSTPMPPQKPPTPKPKPRSRSRSKTKSKSKPQVPDNDNGDDIDSDHSIELNNKKRSKTRSKSKSKLKTKTKVRKKVIDTDSNDPGYCHGCGQTFKNARGLRSHRSSCHSSSSSLEPAADSIPVSISNSTSDPLQSKSKSKYVLFNVICYFVRFRSAEFVDEICYKINLAEQT